MKAATFGIDTADGGRRGLENAGTGRVLHGAAAGYGTGSGAVGCARRRGYGILQWGASAPSDTMGTQATPRKLRRKADALWECRPFAL